MPDTKLTGLSAIPSLDVADLVYIVDATGVTSHKVTVAELLALGAGITFEELDASPSISRIILQLPNGSLTDVDATHAKYTPKFVQLADVLFTSFAGKGGYALQVKSDASGVEAASPYGLVGTTVQIGVVENAGASQVELTVHPPVPVPYYWVTAPFTNATATTLAVMEYPNSQRRQKINLTYAISARIGVKLATTAFTAGTKFGFQYSTDESSWSYLDNVSGPFVAVDALGTLAGAEVNLVAGAKADVFVRLIEVGGDGGTQAAQVGPISLQLR